MKNSLLFIVASAAIVFLSCMTRTDNSSTLSKSDESSFYDFKMNTLEGDTIDFKVYKGKKVLLVNTASKCGFTPQYEELQKLHEKYGDKVAVLGFPCNQFGGQEPGTSAEIAGFCKRNYGVSFQVFEKIDVKGDTKHPLYQWLTDKNRNGWNDKEPSWNFCKYLINEKGELVSFYGSTTGPMSKKLLDDIKN